MYAAINASAWDVHSMTSSCRAIVQRLSRLILLLAVAAAFLAAQATEAQSPMAPSTATAPPAPVQPTPNPTDAGIPQPVPSSASAPTFATPPVAIVPLDKSIPGAALEVAGPLQAWNGRAYITGSGTITAGDTTAQVTLPYRGTMHVCASSTVKLAADSSAASGNVPGLLVALDRGAVEMSFAASTAREQNADTLLTPYFRIMIGGPNAADVSVRMGDDGDTCVDNAGANAPYVVVTSVFEGGVYRVQPGQRVMFEHGSLQKVVDQEQNHVVVRPLRNPRPTNFRWRRAKGLRPSRLPRPQQTQRLDLAKPQPPSFTRATNLRRKRSRSRSLPLRRVQRGLRLRRPARRRSPDSFAESGDSSSASSVRNSLCYGISCCTPQGARRMTWPGLSSWNIKLHCIASFPVVAP